MPGCCLGVTAESLPVASAVDMLPPTAVVLTSSPPTADEPDL